MQDPIDLDLDRPAKPSRGWWIVGSGIALVVLGPVVWIGGTALGMYSSFRRIEELAAPTPGELAEGVYMTQAAAIAGVLCFLAGLVLALVGVLCVQRDARAS